MSSEPLKTGGVASNLLDLRGISCPLNYAKAKIALENIPAGETLEIILDCGEPEANVPSSLREDGYLIHSLRHQEGAVFIRVTRK